MARKTLFTALLTLFFLALAAHGCTTWAALTNTHPGDVTAGDVNAVTDALVADANTTAALGSAIGQTSTQVGVLLGVGELVGLGAILSGLAAVAGAFVQSKSKRAKRDTS